MRHWFIIPMPGIVCSSRAKQLPGLFTMHTVAVMRRMRNSVARLGTRYQLFFGSDPRSLGCNSDGDNSVLSRLLPWTVRIRRRGGVLQGLPPESFEEFVGPAPEEHGVGSRHARRGGLGLLVVGHDPVQVAVGTREVAIGGEPVEGEDAARGSHT